MPLKFSTPVDFFRISPATAIIGVQNCIPMDIVNNDAPKARRKLTLGKISEIAPLLRH